MLQGKHITFSYQIRQKGRQMSWQMFRLKSESTIL